MPDIELQSRNAGQRVLPKLEAVVRILLVLVFLAAGAAKILGAAPMVKVFEQVGQGQWFRYLTGVLEVSGALMLVFGSTRLVGAVVLAMVSLGATVAHLTVLGGSPIPALVLLALCGVVMWLRRIAQKPSV